MTQQAAEGFVQISPDSIGKKIRNFTLIVTEPDGTTQTVFMNAVVAVDVTTGEPMNLATKEDIEETNRLLRAVVKGLEILIDEELLENSEGE